MTRLNLTGWRRKLMDFETIRNAKRVKLEYAMDSNLRESSKLCAMLIDAGFGNMKFSETAERRNESPVFARYVDLGDECSLIRMEQDRRIGRGIV